MNIYLISQDAVNGYDTFDSAVVIARTAYEARCIRPNHETSTDKVEYIGTEKRQFYSWANNVTDVTVKLIGKAHPSLTKEMVVCASFNAG